MRSSHQSGPVARVPGTTATRRDRCGRRGARRRRSDSALRNITLIGYAQYAYQNGGGNITALPGAPQKLIAANDYRRIYDLQNTAACCTRSDATTCSRLPTTAATTSRCSGRGSTATWPTTSTRRARRSRGGDARDRRMWMLHQPGHGGARGADRRGDRRRNRRQQNGLTLVDLR